MYKILKIKCLWFKKITYDLSSRNIIIIINAINNFFFCKLERSNKQNNTMEVQKKKWDFLFTYIYKIQHAKMLNKLTTIS